MSSCEWKPSPIFPNEYKVSENGDVWSNRSNRILRPATDKFGYLYYVLCVNGKRVTVKAHRLVAMAFIDNPNELPFVDHIDGNKENNSITNLRWVTDEENREHAKVLRAMAKAMNT